MAAPKYFRSTSAFRAWLAKHGASEAMRKDEKSSPYSYEQPIEAVLAAAELRAFQSNKAAWKYFAASPPGYRKLTLYWSTMAKKPETRAARLAKAIAASAAGKRRE